MAPFVVPGHYTVRLGVPGAAPVTTRLDVQLDPRLAADGITAEDLEAQHDLVLRIAALAADAQQFQNDVRAARQRLEQGGRAATLRQVSALEQRLVTQSGQAYAQPMLLAQISYLNGIVSRGDNRPHRDAFERYAELRRELDEMRAEFQRIGD
jgi:hypothetical protein